MHRLSQTRKQRIRAEVRSQRRRRAVITTSVIGAVMVIVVLVLIFSQTRPSQSGSPSSLALGDPISQSLYSDMSGVSDGTLSSSATAQGVTTLQPLSWNPLTSSSKPDFLYIGADFCPYCAAERWSIIVALSRFGSFTGLTYMLSSDAVGEPYANTSTFSFVSARYASPYLSFESVELLTREKTALQATTGLQKSVWDHFDPTEGIAFVDVGNSSGIHYVMSNQYRSGSQYFPDALSGLNWTQIGSQLNTPSSNVAQKIDGAADTIISAICKLDGGQPSGVCSQSYAKIVQAPFLNGQMMPEDPSHILQTSDQSRDMSDWKGSL